MTSPSSVTGASSGFYVGGPEVMLRVTGHSISVQRGQVAMQSGPWLADPAAGNNRAAVSVALDDVTGYIVDAGSPDGQWPVSLGIRVDFLADLPLDPTTLTVTGELVDREGRGAMSQGTVTDTDGRILARMIQRSHLVDAPTTPGEHATADILAAPDGSVREQLGLVETAAGVLTMAPTALSANGMGSVHGGILVCLSELAAMSAIGAAGEMRTTSIDIAYVRPCDATDTTTLRAEIVHRGRSVALVRVVSANSSGKPASIATVILQRL